MVENIDCLIAFTQTYNLGFPQDVLVLLREFIKAHVIFVVI